jgi:hypothetical protein
MESVVVNLPVQLAVRVKEAAGKIGISTEEFIKSGVEEKLLLFDSDFRNAIEHVLKKNADKVYRKRTLNPEPCLWPIGPTARREPRTQNPEPRTSER